MMKSLLKKGLIAILIVCIFGLAAVGCSGKNGGDPNNDDASADKAALSAELALEVTSQGDYTADSYNAYTEKLANAKAVANDTAAVQADIDKATAELTAARLALAVRPVEAILDANKTINLISGESKELVIADYVNVNGLSKITYKILTSNECVTLSPVADGKFTVTAGEVSQETTVKVSINVYYGNVAKRAVELSVNISPEPTATLANPSIVREYDLVVLGNKESIVLDFAENVINLNNLPLTYSAKRGDEELTLDGSSYTYVFGTYTDEAVYETFTVTVSWTVNGKENSVEYTYQLILKDSGKYSVQNGGFENGLEGWTVVGNIGNVSSDTHYWLDDPESTDGFAFGMDGEKMFSAYAPGAFESAVGTLTSSPFTVGGSGYVTFKLGAMRDGNYVYVDVVDANTKEILARYYNGLWAERTDGVKSGCTLIPYKADLSEFMGREVFFRISDNADSGYGLFFVDSFVTHYTLVPSDEFNDATPTDYEISGTIYDVFNGGFEMGDVQGWWNNGEIGLVTDANGYWADNIPYGKNGTYLFTGVESFGADTMREGNRGTLTSSTFEIGGTGYISFMLGGGGSVLCYVQVIDATTGEILARYHQQAQNDAVLIQYVADLSAYIGRTARIQVVDQADSGWGCVSFDNVVTYYASIESLPEGTPATDIKDDRKYTIDNGGFESGNLDGWTMDVSEAGTQNTLGWVTDTEIDAGWYTKNDGIKEGDYLFTFVLPDDTNCESSKGTLTSSAFTLEQGAFVSFMFGGAGGGSNHDVYVELCRADGSVIARFYNDAEGKVNTKMNAYYYQYNGIEVECFFRVVDNSTGDYGCFVVDDFRVNLEAAPEGYIEAIQ